jgi:hypothetical protein
MKRLDNYVKMIGGVATAEYTAVASAYATLIEEIALAFRNPAARAARVVTPSNETIAQAAARATTASDAVIAAQDPERMSIDYAAALRSLRINALAVINAAVTAEIAPVTTRQEAEAERILTNDVIDAAARADATAAAATAAAAAVQVVSPLLLNRAQRLKYEGDALEEAAPRRNQINAARVAAFNLVALAEMETIRAAARVAAVAAAAAAAAAAAGPAAPGAAPAAAAGAAAAAAAAAAAGPAAPGAAPAAPTPQAVYYDSGPAEPTSFNVSVYRTKDGKDSFVGSKPAYPSTSVKSILTDLKQSGETVIVSSGEQFVKSLNGKETYSTLGNLRLKSESVKFFVL